MLAHYLDIRFIPRLHVIDRAFVVHIELVAVISRRFAIIKDGLIREPDLKHLFQDKSGFSCGDGKRDVKGKYQPQDVMTAVDAGEIDLGPHRFRVVELGELIVIFPVLIMQFIIGVVFVLLQQFKFLRVQFFLGLDICRTEMTVAFMDSDFSGAFPAKEG